MSVLALIVFMGLPLIPAFLFGRQVGYDKGYLDAAETFGIDTTTGRRFQP